MENIVLIEGNVEYKITLDPSVWIFDDRKIDLVSFLETGSFTETATENDAISIAKQWTNETGPSISPPIERSTKKFQKEKVLTGTFGMPIEPFLKNASPKPDAKEVAIVTRDGDETTISLTQANQLMLAFSKEGKPLKADGPLHVYYGDLTNKEKPITKVQAFIIK